MPTPVMRPDSPRLLPASMWQEYRSNPDKRVPKTLPRVSDITTDWVEGITKGTTPCSNFDYAVPLTEVIVLGTMAIRTGKTIEWDPEAMKVTNDNPGAQALVNVRVSRKPRLLGIKPVREVTRETERTLADRGRVLLRYSGTERLARVMVEGPEARTHADRIADVVRDAIGDERLDGKDVS